MSDNPGTKQQKENLPAEAELTNSDMDRVVGGIKIVPDGLCQPAGPSAAVHSGGVPLIPDYLYQPK